MLIRINLALIAVFVLAALGIGMASRTLLRENATRQVLAEAGLMMDSAFAIRTYTTAEVLPLLNDMMKSEFHPHSVPSYAAAQHFLKLREQRAEYAYKEATLNPTNPRDSATEWVADIVQRFRNDAAAREVTGERETWPRFRFRPVPVAAVSTIQGPL